MSDDFDRLWRHRLEDLRSIQATGDRKAISERIRVLLGELVGMDNDEAIDARVRQILKTLPAGIDDNALTHWVAAELERAPETKGWFDGRASRKLCMAILAKVALEEIFDRVVHAKPEPRLQ